jgi:hypothetical protein
LTMQRAAQGYIPTGGALLGCDFYVPDPNSETGNTKRARIPSESLQWLVKQIEAQGQSLEQIEGMSGSGKEGVASEMVRMGAGMIPAPKPGVQSTNIMPPSSMVGGNPHR